MSKAPQDARGAYLGLGDRVIVVDPHPALRAGATGTVCHITEVALVDVALDGDVIHQGYHGWRFVELSALTEGERI